MSLATENDPSQGACARGKNRFGPSTESSGYFSVCYKKQTDGLTADLTQRPLEQLTTGRLSICAYPLHRAQERPSYQNQALTRDTPEDFHNLGQSGRVKPIGYFNGQGVADSNGKMV